MKSAQKLFSLRHSEIFESFDPVELGTVVGNLRGALSCLSIT